ncbi:MAG: hypothetical protein ABI589_02240 [Burkholderiales bacterium]
MRRIWIAVPLMACSLALAKLPPPDDAAKAKSAEAAAKSAWNSKVGAYKLCKAQDNAARNYKQNKGTSATDAPAQPLPACVDPGPYVSAQAGAKKEMEAAGAHSTPATASAPPVSPERKDPVDKDKEAGASGTNSAPASAGSASTFSISPGGDKSKAQAVPIPVPAPVPLPAVPARASTASPAAPSSESAPRN